MGENGTPFFINCCGEPRISWYCGCSVRGHISSCSLSGHTAIMLFGLAGMAIAYFYSAKPFQFAIRGLGDILVYIAMGFLMTWGAYYVQIPRWSWLAFAASVPVGFLVVAILNMNNTRDIQDDIA